MSSRTDRIFDELKKQDVARTRQQKSKQPELAEYEYNGSSDDDIFPMGQQTTTTTVEVHGNNETGQTDNKKTTRQKKLAETEQQNTSMKTVPAKNFYERNSREKAPQATNNNEERKTECPICRLSFPMSVIEVSCIVFKHVRYFLMHFNYRIMPQHVYNLKKKQKYPNRIVIFVRNVYR